MDNVLELLTGLYPELLTASYPELLTASYDELTALYVELTASKLLNAMSSNWNNKKRQEKHYYCRDQPPLFYTGTSSQ